MASAEHPESVELVAQVPRVSGAAGDTKQPSREDHHFDRGLPAGGVVAVVAAGRARDVAAEHLRSDARRGRRGSIDSYRDLSPAVAGPMFSETRASDAAELRGVHISDGE